MSNDRCLKPAHSKPIDGAVCLCSWDEITEKEYVEYQTMPSGKWHPAKYGIGPIKTLLNIQFDNYIESVQKTDCLKELKRLLDTGPPVWICDKHGLPIPEDETHISKLWYMNEDIEVSAQLKNSLIGKERIELWDRLKSLRSTNYY